MPSPLAATLSPTPICRTVSSTTSASTPTIARPFTAEVPRATSTTLFFPSCKNRQSQSDVPESRTKRTKKKKDRRKNILFLLLTKSHFSNYSTHCVSLCSSLSGCDLSHLQQTTAPVQSRRDVLDNNAINSAGSTRLLQIGHLPIEVAALVVGRDTSIADLLLVAGC